MIRVGGGRRTPNHKTFGNAGLGLDFTRGILDSRIDFTRGSSATYFDSTGTLQTASTNVARFDYDPSILVPRGLLIEEARTNSIRNNTMQGASAGTPGTMPTNWSTFTTLTGLTRTVVGTGTENGLSYIDIRLNGTPSAAGHYFLQTETSTSVAASNGQTWAGSAFYKLVGGTLTGVTFVNYVSSRDSGGADLGGGSVAFTPTASALSAQRAQATFTNVSASTAAELHYVDMILTGAAVDFTLRIGMPQLELGAFATSVISTSSAAVTRAADVASMTGTNFSSWYNQSEGTFVVGFDSVDLTGFPHALSVSDGTNNEALLLRLNAGTSQFVVFDGGAVQANLFSGNASSGTAQKMAASYATNNFAFTRNSATLQTDVSGSLPTPNAAQIGAAPGGGAYLNGHLRSISYYPTARPNSLQALTS